MAIVVSVVAVIGLAVFSFVFSDRDRGNLGDDVFEAPASTVRAQSPLLINDPLGGDRPIYLTHQGDDATSGYAAFAALDADGCLVEIDRATVQLVNSCTGAVVPPDGRGLQQYPVTYDDGRLQIDLNFADR